MPRDIEPGMSMERPPELIIEQEDAGDAILGGEGTNLQLPRREAQ